MRLFHFASEEDWQRALRENAIFSRAEKNRKDGVESWWEEAFYRALDELVWLTRLSSAS